MAAPRPFVRPMGAWWRRNPFFIRYLARELTCVAVGAYALLLLTGLLRAADGEAALASWLAFLRAPQSLVLQGVLLVGIAYHAITWFLILPRTLPPVIVGGHRVPAFAIRAAGLAVAAMGSLAVALVGARFLGA